MAATSKVLTAQHCRDPDRPKDTHSINHPGGLRGRGEGRGKAVCWGARGEERVNLPSKAGDHWGCQLERKGVETELADQEAAINLKKKKAK